MTGDAWKRLAAELESSRTAVRSAAARARGGLLPTDAPRAGAIQSVHELYRIRELVDSLIDAEVIRGHELGVSFDLLGSSRQQAQQRHARAVRQRQLTKPVSRVRNSSTRIDAKQEAP